MVRLNLLVGAALCALGFCSAAYAQTTLVTIVYDDASPKTSTWWPNYTNLPLDHTFRHQLERYNTQTIDPAAHTDIRFSPAIYAAGPLSSNNAKSLATLFKASQVLNGKLHWNCYNASYAMLCEVVANLELLDVKSQQIQKLSPMVSAHAATIPEAQTRAVTLLASELAVTLHNSAQNSNDEIPYYAPKPVLVLDSLPDADTLVALRKALKRIDGVDDVAERWISNASLALEINPDNPIMLFESFDAIVSQLIASKQDNFIVRETRRNKNGIAVEIVTY